MIKGKKSQGGPTASGMQIIIFFVILFAIAMIIIGMAGYMPQNIKAVLNAITPFG